MNTSSQTQDPLSYQSLHQTTSQFVKAQQGIMKVLMTLWVLVLVVMRLVLVFYISWYCLGARSRMGVLHGLLFLLLGAPVLLLHAAASRGHPVMLLVIPTVLFCLVHGLVQCYQGIGRMFHMPDIHEHVPRWSAGEPSRWVLFVVRRISPRKATNERWLYRFGEMQVLLLMMLIGLTVEFACYRLFSVPLRGTFVLPGMGAVSILGLHLWDIIRTAWGDLRIRDEMIEGQQRAERSESLFGTNQEQPVEGVVQVPGFTF